MIRHDLKKLKVCLLANAQSVHTQRWARYFVARGHDVSAISLSPGQISGAKVHYLAPWPWVKSVGYLLTLPQVRRLLAEIRPDILHAHYAISYGVLGALCGFRPLVIGAWGSDILVSPAGSFIRWAALARALRSADLITSLAGHITQVMAEHGVPVEKIETLPFGVDTDVFYPMENGQTRDVNIICTRNLDAIYNIETLLEAIKIVVLKRPEVTCVLAGDGPRRQSLHDLARRLGIEKNLRWLGWISPQELAGWLRRSQMYVSASLSDGTSTALTEAMACGCLPIASDIEANQPWIRDGDSGFLVPATRPDLLADRILLALESPDLRSRAAQLNEATVQERANWHSIMGRVEGHYFRLVGSAHRPRKLRLSDAL